MLRQALGQDPVDKDRVHRLLFALAHVDPEAFLREVGELKLPAHATDVTLLVKQIAMKRPDAVFAWAEALDVDRSSHGDLLCSAM
jgi:hypothetical protein